MCALAAIGLMTWSLLDPRPIPVVVAMSVGQALGTASLVAFLVVVSVDLRKRMLRLAVLARIDRAQQRRTV